MLIKKDIQAYVQNLPSKSGVYLFKDSSDRVIYVGKALNLKVRVRSYFSGDKSFKNQFLTPRIHKVDYILTDTESSAFLLEATLIKKYKPRYNVRLKDDKSYPYIRCSLKDTFPRFYMERRVKQKGSVYFGPYTEALFVRKMIRFLNQQFQIRDCSNTFMKSRKKPCLTYHIGHCKAPCVKNISQNQYLRQVKKALAFLKGKNQTKVLAQLKKRMKKCATEEHFEEAGRLRDRMKAIKLCQPSLMGTYNKLKNQDIWAFYSEEGGLIFQTLYIREGSLTGQGFQYLSSELFLEQKYIKWTYFQKNLLLETVTSVLFQYYIDNLLPDIILLPLPTNTYVESHTQRIGGNMSTQPPVGFSYALLAQGLSEIRGKPVEVRGPKGLAEKALIQMALKNAKSRFKEQKAKADSLHAGLKEVQKKLRLNTLPFRMEGYDISHFHGQNQAGSQVVFEKGEPKKSDYRKYNIKLAGARDDFASLKEVLTRRFKHKEYPDPDLILVDGGPGQLQMALKALKSTGKSDIPIVALAKRKLKSDFRSSDLQSKAERLYLPGRRNALVLSPSSPALKLLCHLRDEAHRFSRPRH